MIIFGTKARHKTVGKGKFYCPHCQAQREYERKKAKRYFTLYFVPIIPMDDMGEFIECQTCHTAFSPDILNVKPALRKLSLAEMLNSIQQLLESGMPVEYLIRDLTAAGLEREVAKSAVNAQIGTERKVCPSCGLTYSTAVDTCSECHQPLEPYVK